MLNALQRNEVDAVLIDTYSMASFQPVLDKKSQKVKALIDANTGYGFVLAGMSQALKPTIVSMIGARQKVISDFISKMKEKIPVRRPLLLFHSFYNVTRYVGLRCSYYYMLTFL